MQDFKSLLTLSEEPLKSKIKDLFFENFTYVGHKIDFCITKNLKIFGDMNLLWAEVKAGKSELSKSFTQLILTLGRYKFFTQQTPNFIATFDGEKIAFLSFYEVQEFFTRADIDFSVTPSNYKSETFISLLNELIPILTKAKIFYYAKDEAELKDFIKRNLIVDTLAKFPINKDNFVSIYYKWLESVSPTININWKEAQKYGVVPADFYLADLLSKNDESFDKNLFAVLEKTIYKFNEKKTDFGSKAYDFVNFKDEQKAHKQFWQLYEHSPRKEFWHYMIKRRELLLDKDTREFRGEFFTPDLWVDKACEYMAKALGRDFEEHYYIWDCAGGMGNLLKNFTNAKNIFLSTLQQAEINNLHSFITQKRLNLYKDQVFQFDFLNDEFFGENSKLPLKLQEILSDEEKRKRLIIFINPPYAEATTASTVTGTGKNKKGVAKEHKIAEKYKELLGKAKNELFAQFLMRIYKEIPDCILAQFSTLKIVQGKNFQTFRQNFKAKFLKGFICPANTFDNVKGNFPIGFFVWDTSQKIAFRKLTLDVFKAKVVKGEARASFYMGTKSLYVGKKESINQWIKQYDKKGDFKIGLIDTRGNDFQNQQYVNLKNENFVITAHSMGIYLTEANLIAGAVYFAVRRAIAASWLNDRDQFYKPCSWWDKDKEFQSDCLAFMLFHGQNKITGKGGG